MANVLIINEKPSVSMEFSKALGVKQTEKHDGYIEGFSDFFGCTIWITWCIGHLVTLSFPEKYDEKYKKWNIDDLPFLPKEYSYEVIPDVKKQFNIVKKLLNIVGTSDMDKKELSTLSNEKKFLVPVNVIYNAGDSGREGEYIQRLVLQMAGCNKNAVIKRIWIDSQTDEAIKNGIRDAKPSSYYDRLADAAYMRAIEDFAIGINFSRALTCKFGYEFNKKIKSEKYKSINVGRVMTCVLGMIVEREREIKKFVSTSFYKVEANTGFISNWKAVPSSHYYESPLLYNESGFKEKKDAEKLCMILQKDCRVMVENVDKKEEKKKAPLLYNLAELQSECSKRFKISPDKTLEIAQKLYESKMTTYPRTDARVLSTAVCDVIVQNLNGLMKSDEYSGYIKEIVKNGWNNKLSDTKYCNDEKITDHYAIIPTGISADKTSQLSELERKVYDLIVRRFLSIFYPPAEYLNIQISLVHPSGERFYVTKKALIKKGYLEIADPDAVPEDNALNQIKNNQVLKAAFQIKEGKTTPPKRYDSGSIILAMENAGNLIEDEELRSQIKDCGIGTSATRAEIIKKLIQVGYICLNDKTQIITPHKDGEIVYDIVADNIPQLLSPKMTANWEKGLVQIEQGELTPQKYREILENYVRKNVDSIKGKRAEQRVAKEEPDIPKVVGKCPACGGNIIRKSFGYGCSNYKADKKGCNFTIGQMIADKLDAKQLENLLTKGKTDVIKGFVSKKNKEFSAKIVYNKEENKIEFSFPN